MSEIPEPSPIPEFEELDQVPHESSEADSELDVLAAHLRDLGAETDTERKVKQVIPWISSAIIHTGLILMGFLIVVAVQTESGEEPVEIVGDFYQMTYQPLPILNPNQDEQDRKTAQDKVQTDAITETLTEQLRNLDIDPIHLLSNAAGNQELAEFAPQPKQGSARFAGLTGTNAREIVFVVDASGSMIGTLQIVIEELARSIEGLVPEQSFSIIFFQRNEALVVPPDDRLIPATEDEKLRALKWIRKNVIPAGRSNPIAAIEKALDLEPDLIFLLSNNITGSGQFEIDQEDLLALLDELNPIDKVTGRRETQIQCIQFLDPDPLDTLRKIAEAHSGSRGYKFLDRRELGIGGG